MSCAVLLRLLVGTAGILVFIALTRLGLGSPFSSPVFPSLSPLLSSSSLDIVALLDVPPGNLAVTNSGRVYFNFHPEYNPKVKIAELLQMQDREGTTSWRAYPNEEYQSRLTSVLSMRVDHASAHLWLLDFAMHGMLGTPALRAISLKTDEEEIEYFFPKEVAGMGSMLNDFAISENSQFLYIADTSILAQSPAIIVYSVSDNKSYRMLSSLPSLYGQSSFFNLINHSIGFGPFGMKINVDSIALSRDNRALYFSPLTGSELLCIEIDRLHDALCSTDDVECSTLQAKAAESVTVVLKDKPITDGITTDEDGNVWLTALEHSSIGVASRTEVECINSTSEQICQNAKSSSVCEPLKMYNVVKDVSLLRWADGFSFGPDGLYVSNSALYMKFNNIPLEKEAPYHIVKLGAESLLRVKTKLSGVESTEEGILSVEYSDILRGLSGQ